MKILTDWNTAQNGPAPIIPGSLVVVMKGKARNSRTFRAMVALAVERIRVKNTEVDDDFAGYIDRTLCGNGERLHTVLRHVDSTLRGGSADCVYLALVHQVSRDTATVEAIREPRVRFDVSRDDITDVFFGMFRYVSDAELLSRHGIGVPSSAAEAACDVQCGGRVEIDDIYRKVSDVEEIGL